MQRKASEISQREAKRKAQNGKGDYLEETHFTEVHHVAWLNWKKDGSPEEMDMEYLLAAESLLLPNLGNAGSTSANGHHAP
jgi:hypothetical protein